MPAPNGAERDLPPARAESNGGVQGNAVGQGHPESSCLRRKGPGRPAGSLHLPPEIAGIAPTEANRREKIVFVRGRSFYYLGYEKPVLFRLSVLKLGLPAPIKAIVNKPFSNPFPLLFFLKA